MNIMDARTNTKPRCLPPPGLALRCCALALALLLGATGAQSQEQSLLNLSEMAKGLSREMDLIPAMTGQGAQAPANQNTLPAPPPEHIIPMRRAADPGSVEIQNLGGEVRLVVRDAPLRQVLGLLAESQKLNLVFASVSDASLTVSLDRVPLETALDAILSSCGHTWTMQGNIIHVTQVAEGVAVGPTAQGRRLEVFDLNYAAAADVDLAVKGLLSPVGKSWITSSSPTDNRRTRESIAVEDLPEYVERIAAFIAQSDQPPRQVLVEVQLLQVELDGDRRVGVNFHELGRLGGTGIRFESTGFADKDSPQAFFIELAGGDLTSLVELLQTTSDAKTLASPKLLAVNGQLARIQIGEKLPYRLTTTTQTSTQESVQFLDVGIVLEFTPWITHDGRVLMRIRPKVSSGQVNATTELPEERTTEVETNAFLSDGQGIVIGGLISEETNVDQSKLAVLGDIPYAGALFQRRAEKRLRKEIIVAIMPHLLPYNCEMQAQNDFEVERARDSLTYGPLCKNPRPYEPRLPDPTGDLCRKFPTDRACREGGNCNDGHARPRIFNPFRRDTIYYNPDGEQLFQGGDQPSPTLAPERMEIVMPDNQQRMRR